jgi:hypothetical protein
LNGGVELDAAEVTRERLALTEEICGKLAVVTLGPGTDFMIF